MANLPLINEFQQALQDEIEYIKERGGGSKFNGKDGELLEERGGKFYYQFIIDVPAVVPDDSPIEVKFGDKITHGVIVSIDGLKLLTALEDNIGSSVPQATIIANPYRLLEILSERLQEFTDGQIKLNDDLPQKVFRLLEGKIGEDNNFKINPKLKLNESQKSAVAKTLGSEVSFIWGPPGTGKTHTLAAIADILFKKGDSILILSHTNIAVDNAIEKIAYLLSGNPDFNDGKVLRYGNTQLKKLKGTEVDPNYWVEARSQELIKQKRELELELSQLGMEILPIERMCALNSTIERIEGGIEKTRGEINNLSEEKILKETSMKDTGVQLKEVRSKLLEASQMSGLRRFFTGLDPTKLENEKARLKLLLTEVKSKLKETEGNLREKEIEERNTKDEFKRLQEELTKIAKNNFVTANCSKCHQKLWLNPQGNSKFLFDCPGCGGELEYTFELDDVPNSEDTEAKLSELNQNIEELKNKIIEIEGKLSTIIDELLREVKLLATTLTKAYTDENIYSRRFDAVIIDEASMAPMPMLFFDCGLAEKKVLIIGDFRQLAPIAQADKLTMVEKWLKRDIFVETGIVEKIDNGKEDPRLIQLAEQHRMNPAISFIANKVIYRDHPLSDAQKGEDEKKKEERTLHSEPFPDHPVVVCDTSNFNPWCAVTTPDYSRFNIYSASLAIHLAKQAINSGIKDLGIISPYRAQSHLLTKMCLDEGLEKVIDPSSVHRFQGREKELIIFDFVEGPGSSYISHLLSGSFGSDSMRLLNVAVTRAKSKLILIGNLQHLLKKLSKQATAREILHLVVENSLVVDSSKIFEFMPKIRKDREEKIVISESKAGWFSQALFYNQFYKDLEKCNRELIIFSPFIYPRRLDDLEQHFRALLNRKVRILVFTKPLPKNLQLFEEGKAEAIEFLKKIGVQVEFKSGMHEKLAVIDDMILWFGTLNILSHQNTTELMTRWSRSKTVEEVLRLLKIPKISRLIQLREKIKNIKHGNCPRCGAPMVVKLSRYGLFLACSRACKETMNLDTAVIEKIFGPDYLICEKCGANMKLISIPRRGKFLGCSRYPDCKFTRPLG